MGDLQLLSSKNLSFRNIPAKPHKKFVGPFEVIKKVGPQAYELNLHDTWKIHNVFHISLLKRWKTFVYRKTEAEDAAELNIEEKKTDVIEKIRRWRKIGRGQRPAYLILWKGHPLEEAAWEPANRFDTEEFQQLLLHDEPEEADDERGRSY